MEKLREYWMGIVRANEEMGSGHQSRLECYPDLRITFIIRDRS